MKKLLIVALMSSIYTISNAADCVGLSCGGVIPPTVNSSGQSQSQGQNTTSDSTANNNGNDQTINFNQPGNTDSSVKYSGSQTVKNVPSIGSPPLTTSNDTCMGSFSGGAAVAGFGLTIGKTYTDSNCIMLKNSREMWNMGMKAAGLALMCTDENNRYALEVTGYECPQTKDLFNRQKKVVK